MLTSRPAATLPGFLLALVIAGASVAGCLGVATPSANAEVATRSPILQPTASATSRPTASPRTPAPAELQGRWQTVISDVDKPILTITDFNYTIQRLGIGTGGVVVHGDQIDFFGSNLCPGTGSYTWAIDGGTLTLRVIGTDPCGNRADAIRGRAFTRLE